MEELVSRVRTHVTERLGAAKCWLALCVGLDGEIALLPPESAADTAAMPLSAMREALKLKIGVMTSAGQDNDTLVAPLMHSGSAFGCLAVRKNTGRSDKFSVAQLDYLLAVAECVSPLVLARERIEQLERDWQSLEQRHGATLALIGNSTPMVELRARIRDIALANGNVMLRGETGVGKELVARAIHDASKRAAGPYVIVNCPAIPDSLFESEVFGYEPGAFTGASKSRKGLFEQAHGGTLFLDEIGDLSPTNQARLLRVAETNTFRRLGSENERVVDVRIISATNRDLAPQSPSGFRQDLVYRLAGSVLMVPPLREHRDDIPELARHFLRVYARHSTRRPVHIDEEALEHLCSYRWPGNVRELKNAIEHAFYRTNSGVIGRHHLSLHALDAPSSGNTPATSLDDIERAHLIDVLKQHNGNVSESAVRLGIAASTLYYKLKRHRINLRNLDALPGAQH